MLAIAAFFGLMYLAGNPPEVELFAEGTVIQGSLPDGTTVSVNKYSMLTYPEKFKEGMRKVSLEGEAFFEVTPNKKKPFIIEAGGARVKVVDTSRVIATSFDVKAYPNEGIVRVSVETGKVLLYPIRGEMDAIKLEAGEAGVFETGSKRISRSKGPEPDFRYWKDRILRFKRTRLEKVAVILNKIFDVEIRFSNERLKQCQLTVTFEQQEMESIIKVIEEDFMLRSKWQNGIVILEGEGC